MSDVDVSKLDVELGISAVVGIGLVAWAAIASKQKPTFTKAEFVSGFGPGSREGIEAYEAGTPREMNPYDPAWMSDVYQNWNKAWDTAAEGRIKDRTRW